MNKIYKSKSIIEFAEGNKIFIKSSEKNIEELFEYLKTRSFLYLPKILEIDKNKIKYEYIKSKNVNNPNKYLELAKIISLLHYKTSFFKDVSKNKYREIYDKLSDKIDYITEYYNKLIETIELEIYPSPAHYLIERNFSIIQGCINYSKSELKSWFKLVENKEKERVVVVHNNPLLEHLIVGEEGTYLTNWDNYVVDTPILDLYKMYKEDTMFNDFLNVYNEYSKNFVLNEEEKKLFFILISIPPVIEEIENELINTRNIRYIISSIYKTNNLIASINPKEKMKN